MHAKKSLLVFYSVISFEIWQKTQLINFQLVFLRDYVGGQDERVPPLNTGHFSFSNLFFRGNQCQLGGCLDPCLLCCLGNLILESFQLGLSGVDIRAEDKNKGFTIAKYVFSNNQNIKHVFSNLSPNSLSNFLKAPLLMEFKGPARALSSCYKNTLIEVRCGFQVVTGLLFQLLTELLPLYRSYIGCTGRWKLFEVPKKMMCAFRN